MFDFISIFLGVLGWAIPVRAMLPRYVLGGWHYVVLSLGACAISMQMQVFQIMSVMNGGSVVEDATFESVTFRCGVMILGTFLLNGVSVVVKRKKMDFVLQKSKSSFRSGGKSDSLPDSKTDTKTDGKSKNKKNQKSIKNKK